MIPPTDPTTYQTLKAMFPIELSPGQLKQLARYVNQRRVDEVDRYADYLSDCEEEAAFEMEWQAYSYKRIRLIDAEEMV